MSTFRVELADPTEEFEVTVDGRDLRKWEATYGESYVTTPTSVTQTAQLGHLAAQRAGLFPGDWAAFDARATDVSVVRGEAVGLGADPTHEEATDASSAS